MKEELNQDVSKLVELVKDVKTCMLITIEKYTENLSGRPMGISHVEEDGTMWFFTKMSSPKVDEIEQNAQISLAIISESKNVYLMINGNARLSYDYSKMKEFWSPIMKAWFPMGIDDPELILIKVIPTEASYWDSSSNKMVVAFNMVKALVTGKEYNEGKHGKINL
ncbi:pyridoxamine 5'-phosphate oxidase family protein [Cytophaga aurantiaca]|uniref:pyridoxamine 5'-phosphate oxidase family protein n=1 Tax=Cytophaga aurantiaca TaxID=29530 RepID=UPI00036587D8|nr:pyridoxamine 5'-phosphate oxidase family protein [Cytophaga aurantiaca]